MQKYLGIVVLGIFAGLGVGWPNGEAPEAVQTPKPVAMAQEKKPDEVKAEAQPAKKYPRGRKAPTQATLDARHAAAKKRHFGRMRALPVASLTSYDLRTLGCVPPPKNQGSCGSCYQFGGADTCEIALMKAGQMSVTSGGLAEQYGMDCQNWGGCGGGDEAEVIQWCKTNGLPSTTDYGTYQARSNRCALKPGTKMWQIKDWGYVHSGQGQGCPTIQEMKNALVQYGPISIAIDAGDFDGYQGGVITVSGESIDHAVMIIGYVDDAAAKGGGYYILRNSWGSGWGEAGYLKLSYASYFVEAIWTSATELPPPPPPPPPPGPVPPPVPPPGPGPIPGGIPSITLQNTGSLYDGKAMELADPTVMAAARQLAAALATAQPAPTPEPPTSIEGRLDALEANRAADRKAMAQIADSILQLQRLIGGK